MARFPLKQKGGIPRPQSRRSPRLFRRPSEQGDSTFDGYRSHLISLRHHTSVWIAPAFLLVLALLPWPYGYYIFLRLAVSVLAGWLAYEQWKLDDAVSGWVVALGGVALLYNPLLPVHMTREIWSVLNLGTACIFLWHLAMLRRLIIEPRNQNEDSNSGSSEKLSSNERTPVQARRSKPFK